MTENQKQEILGFFTEKKTAYAFKGVMFLFDQIPEKKLQDAIKHYASAADGEEAVLLYVYSAKEGFLLTTRTLYVNQPALKESKCVSVPVADISELGWAKGKGMLNPEEYVQIHAGSKLVVIQYMYAEPLMNALNSTVGVLQGGTAGVSASGTASQAAAPQPAAQKGAGGSSPVDTITDVADKAKDVADKAKNALGKLGGLFGKK